MDATNNNNNDTSATNSQVRFWIGLRKDPLEWKEGQSVLVDAENEEYVLDKQGRVIHQKTRAVIGQPDFTPYYGKVVDDQLLKMMFKRMHHWKTQTENASPSNNPEDRNLYRRVIAAFLAYGSDPPKTTPLFTPADFRQELDLAEISTLHDRMFANQFGNHDEEECKKGTMRFYCLS